MALLGRLDYQTRHSM